MPKVAIAFGSNVGQRLAFVTAALGRVAEVVTSARVSSLYESAPMYVTDQPSFLNGVVLGETELSPAALLEELNVIEVSLGRHRRAKNGPREIDLDIVWVEGYSSPPGAIPVVPHHRAHERRFVLEPLAELDPGLELQGFGTVSSLLADPSVQSQEVSRVHDAPVLL